MSAAWKKHDAGFFSLDLPPGWVMEEPNPGTLLINDSRGEMALTLFAVSKPIGGAGRSGAVTRKIAPKEAQFELQKWIDSQSHVKVRQAPRLLGTAPHPTATTEGLQHLKAGVSLFKRLLHRSPLMLWRFWAILNSHMLLLASCNGKPQIVEKHRPTVDRILLSIRLPERSILLGRHFADTVVSLARSYFPQMPVAAIDDAHLQFGSQNISLSNLHRRYLASPEQLSTHVRAFLAAVQNDLPASDLASSWNRARSHVMPTLLTPSAVESMAAPIVRDEWINGLSIGYVLEDGGTDRPILEADAKRWKVSLETLHEQSLQNLIGRSHEQTMEGHKADGYTMLVLANPDKHNAARILLPELHRKLREHLGPTFYAALPSREFLLAFSTVREDVLVRVREQIAADYSRAKEGLSQKLFLVTPDGIAGDPAETEDVNF
jgi:uncharacterized protein YtpQ (UPF0354 family)